MEGCSEKESTESPEGAIRLLTPSFKLIFLFFSFNSIFVFPVIRIFATIPYLLVHRSATCVNWEHEVAQSADWRCIVDGETQKGRSRFDFLPFSFFPCPAYLNYLLSRDYSFLLLSILIDRE